MLILSDSEIPFIRPAARLQGLPTDQLWAVADSNILQAIASRDRVTFGRRGARLRALVSAFSKAGLVYPFLSVVGMFQLTKLLKRQHREPHLLKSGRVAIEDYGKPTMYPPYFFVGFGAGPEEALYASYLQTHLEGVGRIDQIDARTLGVWHEVGFLEAVRLLNSALKNARAAISRLPPQFERWSLDFLTSTGIRIAHYAFMRAWFANLRLKNAGLQEVAFLAPDTPAFAAIDAGLPTRYIQHGMVRHSLVLPSFDWVDALTSDEASHFRQRLPSAVIARRPSACAVIAPGTMSRGILVASVYAASVEMQRVSTFIDWGSSRGRQVWVRPHPREDRAFWGEDAVRSRIAIEDIDSSLHGTLARLRPRLVVSWFSTALADALAMGVIPVSVSARDDPNVMDMVYPLHRRCLHWPDDEATIEQVLDDDDAYLTELGRLRSGWDEAPE